MIAGKVPDNNPTKAEAGHWLVPRQRHVSVVKVRKDGVEGWFDDKLVARYKTDWTDVTLPEADRLPRSDAIGIAAWAGVRVESATVTEISGEGKMLRARAGFRRLFDGQTLAGWRLQSGRMASWSVRDGSLVTSGNTPGLLLTDSEFSDFELSLEYKISPNANSGVFIRAPAPEAFPSPYNKLLQIEIVDDDHQIKAGSAGFSSGSIALMIHAARRESLAAGEWNTMDIVARGRNIAVSLNGVQVVDFDLDKFPDLAANHPGLLPASGFIGLESCHGEVEFRNISIRKIGPATADRAVESPDRH